MFFEASAKTGLNVKNIFNDLARKLTGFEIDPVEKQAQEEKQNKGFVLGAQPVD